MMKLEIHSSENFFVYKFILAGAFQKHLATDFASCRPVYDIYHGITVTVCDNLITPLNGVWTSLGMALFFLLPALVLFKLMTIFLRKVRNGLIHDDVDEEDESGDGLLPHQGNGVIIHLTLFLIYGYP